MNVASHPQANGPKRSILYVITKANWGGAQRYVYDLAVAAKKEGHAVTVAFGEPGALGERLATANIPTLLLPSLGREVQFARDLGALSELVQTLKEQHPDVIHLNSSKAGFVGALAARIAGVPSIIFTAHGWAFNEARPWWQKSIFMLIHGATVLLSTKTIAVSQAVAADMAWLPFKKGKMVVIPNGHTSVELKTRSEARGHLLPGHDTDFWIGMVSELHPTKRIEDAIDAFCLLASEEPKAKLVVFGEGAARSDLEKKIRAYSLKERVHLLGHVEDAPTYLSAFDIFLHASRTEALGYVILEAGAAGLPVVATRVGGIPEIIENGVTGVLVPSHDPKRMERALLELMHDAERRARMGEALKQRVAHDFTTEKMVKRTLALY